MSARVPKLVFLLALVAACENKQPEPESRPSLVPAPAPAPPPAPVAPAEPKRALGVTWTAPASFKLVPPSSPMRHASYEIPAAKGDREPADLGIFYFGAEKGGASDANMKRWIQQFDGVDDAKIKRSDRTVNGILQRMVEIPVGTYKSGMPGGPTTPKKNFAMIAAIVEAPSGSHFFKLTGPKATVAAARAPFLEMLDSVKTK